MCDKKMVEKRKKFEEMIEHKSFPYSVSVEATSYCNLKCKMCSNSSMKRKKGYMSMQLFKKIACETAKFFPESRFWMNGYGEPLIHPEFMDMVKYASSLELNTFVNTNGMLLTKDKAEKLFRAGLKHLICSIDGFKKETYEAIRKGGKRDVVYQNITNALEMIQNNSYKTVIEVQLIIMPETIAEKEKWKEYWKSKGANIKFKSYATWGGTVRTRETIFPERYACGDSNVLDILWDGRVPYCSTGDVECKYQLGDVNEETLNTIWYRKLENFCTYHTTHQFDKLPMSCRQCTDWMSMPAEHE